MIRARGLVLLAAVALPAAARAEPLPPRYDLAADAAVTAGAAAANLALRLFRAELAPDRCRWCEPSRLEAELTEAVRWREPEVAARASDGLAFALAAASLGTVVHDGYRRGDPGAGWANALLVTEATTVAMLLDNTVKYAVGRQRPYAWRGETRPGDAHDRNLSFFSGHATFAFAVAASSSTLLLDQGAPNARTWAFVAFGAAATTAYLRVAADRHWPTDVLAGAAVGTLVGWAMPHFLHAPAGHGARPAGAQISFAFVW